jgi:hypothetical protein
MKQQVNASVMQMEEEVLQQLLAQTKETVAEDIKTNVFSATDLWNIQRNMKPALRTKLTDRWKM